MQTYLQSLDGWLKNWTEPELPRSTLKEATKNNKDVRHPAGTPVPALLSSPLPLSLHPALPASSITLCLSVLQGSHPAVLPTNVTWVGCQGSEPHFRGYPCGLWTVFHLLTVQAAQSGPDKGTSVRGGSGPGGRGCLDRLWHGQGCCMQTKACLAPEAGLRGGQEPKSRGVGLPPQLRDCGGGTAGSGLALPHVPPLSFGSPQSCHWRC